MATPILTDEFTCVGCGKTESQEPGGEFGGGSGGPWCSDCFAREGQRSGREDGTGKQTQVMGQSYEPRKRLPMYVTDPTAAAYAAAGYPTPWCSNCLLDLEEYDRQIGCWADINGDTLCTRNPDPQQDHHVPTFKHPSTAGPTNPEEGKVTTTPDDLESIVQTAVQNALAGIGGAPAPQAPARPAPAAGPTFQEMLSYLDPADSDAALAMLDFLLKTGRLGRVGVLDGGQGYLFMYAEPKGATKAGYRPGATQGDRIVDQAVEAQRATGAKPAKRSMCTHCFSIVIEDEESGVIYREDGEVAETADGAHAGTDVCAGSPTGLHEMA